MRVGSDIIGNIAILKFDKDTKQAQKKKVANEILREQKHLTTILEKTNKFSGRLRTQKTKHLAGIRTKEALHKENNCQIRLNVDTCYYSPRLSTERMRMANATKKGENVLVMFGGVAPYAITIAKHSKPKKVVSVEISKECSKYAGTNVKRNKLEDKVIIIQGNVKKKCTPQKNYELTKIKKYDRIIMARPQLKESFLNVAYKIIKRGGMIHYHGFYPENELGEMKETIKQEAKRAKKKIRIIRVEKTSGAGIGVRKFRYRADVKVMN